VDVLTITGRHHSLFPDRAGHSNGVIRGCMVDTKICKHCAIALRRLHHDLAVYL
jgi:hypothetical protein